MKVNPNIRYLIEFNIAMLLMSSSGTLGKYIMMPPPATIWWRCFLAAIFLGLFCKFSGIDLRMKNKRDIPSFILAALFMGIHWISYFYSLHLSNVAIGMLSIFTYPVFTALLEPLILKTKFRLSHIFLAAMVLFGIYFLAPELNLQNSHTQGVLLGLFSAILYALRNIIFKKKISAYSGSMLMFYQMVIITIMFLPFIFVFDTSGINLQWPAVLILALVTTATGHTLFVVSLKHFSVSTASIMSSIQPVYGIIIGILFLHETLTLNVVIGGLLILSTVVIESIRSYR